MSSKTQITILILLSLVLSVRYFYYAQNEQKLSDNQEISLKTTLFEEPKISGSRQKFSVRAKNGQRILITTSLNNQINFGETLKIDGKINERIYKGHTYFSMNYPTVQNTTSDQNFITGLATGIRQNSEKVYKKSLPPVSSDLLSGIVFGGDRGLPKKFMQDLQVNGVTHVIAASGMNVAFVSAALMGVLAYFLKRQMAITITIFGVFFYAFISGFEPSIVRASIMATLSFSAMLLGRSSFALSSLMTTAFAMLFHKPFLLHDVGFQLSIFATLGIILLKPILDTEFLKLGFFGKIAKEDIGTTIAAQIATFPIIAATFGSIGAMSVLVNALVLWTVPVLMILGSISLLAASIYEPLGQVFILPAVPILIYFEKIITFFGRFGWTISIESVSITIWIGYYLILGGFILFVQNKSTKVK